GGCVGSWWFLVAADGGRRWCGPGDGHSGGDGVVLMRLIACRWGSGGVVCGVVLVDRSGVMKAAGWSWWCGDRRLPPAVCGGDGCSGDEGGVRVVDLIDRDTGSHFGVRQKRSPEMFSDGRDGRRWW
nr:hypothetical protein [Tanacetum cinerariifolium]